MIMIVIHPDEGIDFFKGLDAEPDGSRAVEDSEQIKVQLDPTACRSIRSVVDEIV